MIVPDSVKKEWVTPPGKIEILSEDLQTTRTQLEEDLQTEKVKTQQMKEDLQTELEIIKLKLLNTEARLKMVEQTMTSILSKLNV
jgi:hypothetical protein